MALAYLDGTLHHIDLVIIWLYQLQLYIFWLYIFPDGLEYNVVNVASASTLKKDREPSVASKDTEEQINECIS